MIPIKPPPAGPGQQRRGVWGEEMVLSHFEEDKEPTAFNFVERKEDPHLVYRLETYS